jgi:hypothetical protein
MNNHLFECLFITMIDHSRRFVKPGDERGIRQREELFVCGQFRKSEPALHHMHFSGAWFLGEALSL